MTPRRLATLLWVALLPALFLFLWKVLPGARFAHPQALVGLAALLAPLLKDLLHPTPATPLPGASTLLHGLPGAHRAAITRLPGFLLMLAWCALVLALARPQTEKKLISQSTRGIAIEMILDRSGSMRNLMGYRGRSQNRLETVKDVFRAFIFGEDGGDGESMKGRGSDLVGLVGFARYPYTACPLTLDHDALDFALRGIQLVPPDSPENSTAIGDAVAMGVARLVDEEKSLAAREKQGKKEFSLQSKVIILLTDGQDEGEHDLSIAEAGQLALKHGVKVYTIAILDNSPFSPPYDTSDIRKLAETTGGQFFPCWDAKGLAQVCRAIDSLERSDFETPYYAVSEDHYQPFLWAGTILLLLAIALKGIGLAPLE